MIGVVRFHETKILCMPGAITEAAVMIETLVGTFRLDGLEDGGQCTNGDFDVR